MSLSRSITVSGRVQGVYYRASAAEVGKTLALVGWVMNMNNGDVKAHVQGPAEAVEKFIAWCHEGPSLASVQHVGVEPALFEPGMKAFEIRYL